MDRALKQRLTGAVILIALTVIFLPMLLDGESPREPGARIELPEKPEMRFSSRRLPIGGEPATGQPGQQDPRQESGPTFPDLPEDTLLVDSGSDRDSARPEGGMVVTPLQIGTENRQQRLSPGAWDTAESVSDNDIANSTGNSTDSETEPTKPPPDEPKKVVNETTDTAVDPVLPVADGKWRLQVASFSARVNAEKLLARLRRTGYQARIESRQTEGRELFRVIVPGYPDRKAAELAAAAIDKQIKGVSPVVLVPESKSDDPEPEAADNRRRWAVQVGSFGQQANAEKLVDKLTAAGFTVHSETSNGIYKVLTRPVLRREAAERQRDEIFRKFRLRGLVKEQNG